MGDETTQYILGDAAADALGDATEAPLLRPAEETERAADSLRELRDVS